MTHHARAALLAGLAWVLLLAGCGDKKVAEPVKKESLEQSLMQESKQLPARFQKPTYLAPPPSPNLGTGAPAESLDIKVGANITSTRGPQPLWDILKRLAKLKNMNVSWASDVDQRVRVDVDIRAEDNFFEAIDNLLRQVDYFHELQGKTIVVKYKETKQFHVAIPPFNHEYRLSSGGDFLGGTAGESTASSGSTEGLVKIDSTKLSKEEHKNIFKFWENIDQNLKTILYAWQTTIEGGRASDVGPLTEADKKAREKKGEKLTQQQDEAATSAERRRGDGEAGSKEAEATRRIASNAGYFTIDKSVGLITVTAPRPLIVKVDEYLTRLQKELYRQVAIEAKIIEVYLQDNSKIGIDWSSVLKNLNVSGRVEFGLDGQVYPWIPTVDDTESPTRFVTKVNINTLDFNAMVNALEEQGDTRVLANPKLTVLNGQPALISVGKNIAYIKSIKSDVNAETRTVTYTAETSRVVEGIALGVIPSIIDNKTVVMHLAPVATDLLDDTIPYETFGDNLKVGLPRVGIKEMTTMVQVGNGEMLIIGGLIDKIEGKSSAMAPGVGRIPLVRYLFGVEEKVMQRRELVILLTPKIL